ncbi:hypothetical protein Fmac_006706 [Flemingia macrophylla]|uniref:Uncharacterized protein n=1 Tax=Flemingia macrophylla TaxID=520843 RepID=A0ABD1NBX8_9FABA
MVAVFTVLLCIHFRLLFQDVQFPTMIRMLLKTFGVVLAPDEMSDTQLSLRDSCGPVRGRCGGQGTADGGAHADEEAEEVEEILSCWESRARVRTISAQPEEKATRRK